MYDKFLKALTWNTAGAFFYKIALLVHQIILYSVVSKSTYGIIGTLFATIYLAISLTNFGFEYTLLPFFQQFQKSKQNFKQVLHHLLLRLFAICALSLFCYVTLIYKPFSWMHAALHGQSHYLYIVVCGIFIFESIKKSINAIMQVAFLNKQVVSAEIAMLALYIVMVWSRYFVAGALNLMDIFAPLLIASVLEVVFLVWQLQQFYSTLTSTSSKNIIQKVPSHLIIKDRAFNYINQISKTLFSPNCMILVLASNFGFAAVGTIKLFTNFISLIYTFLNKTIGITSGAAFSATAHHSNKNKAPIFKTITKRYVYFLFLLSATCVAYMLVSVADNNPAINYHNIAWQIIPFFMVSFLDYVVITYEQFLIANQAAQFLALINLVNIVAILGSVYLSYLSINNILIIMLIVRLCSIVSIHEYVKYKWSINILKNLKNLFIALIIALFLFLCFF